MNDAVFKIDVRPAKRHQLAAPQPGVQHEHNGKPHAVIQAVLVYQLDLLLGQGGSLFRFDGRNLDPFKHVAHYDVVVHRKAHHLRRDLLYAAERFCRIARLGKAVDEALQMRRFEVAEPYVVQLLQMLFTGGDIPLANALGYHGFIIVAEDFRHLAKRDIFVCRQHAVF